jgi:uncharacterized membrane protein
MRSKRELILFLTALAGAPAAVLSFISSTSASSRPFASFKRNHSRLAVSDQRKPHYRQSSSLTMLQTPLIGGSDNWGNIAALTGIATASQAIGKRTRIGRLLGPPVTAMAITFLFASIGILNPGGTASAKALQLLTLQMATPLILLGADFEDCVSRCGPLLLSFAVASFATVVACIVGWYVSGSMLQSALGAKDGLVIAAALMAKNIGGGLNYIAVCQSLAASPQAIAAGLCIDNIFALVYFPATSAIGSGRTDVEPLRLDTTSALKEAQSKVTGESSALLDVRNISTVIFLSSLLLWLGERLGGTLGSLPCCTILTVLFAIWSPEKFLSPLRRPAEVLGTVCLYLFFATAGAPGLAVAESVRASLLPLTIFLSCLYSIHGGILWLSNILLGKKMSSFLPQRLLVASSSAIGGPATSVALAQANNWKSLLVPSLLVGNIGYAIATFCGLAYYAALR